MDQVRKIRFLYPPFMVILSTLIGLFFDSQNSINSLLNQFNINDSTSELLIALLGGSILMLILGFVIEIITTFILRLIFFKKPHYAAAANLLPDTYKKIRKKIFYSDKEIKKNEYLYAAVSFDSSIIPVRIHEWIVRRWNSFNVSCNSIFALLLSILFIDALEIKFSIGWFISLLILIFFLSTNAYLAWTETKKMVEFQTKCNQKN